MEHTPAETKVAEVPLAVQTRAVLLMKVTGSPEVAVAISGTVAALNGV